MMLRILMGCWTFVAISATETPAVEEPLRLLTWNVESGGSDPAVIAQQLAKLDRYHVYGLCEVDPSATRSYVTALGENYKSILSVTGSNDRLMLIYDSERLELLESQELEAHDGVRMNDVNFLHRSPLVGHFKDGQYRAFKVVLVHLARGNAELRQEQAKALRLWCVDQTTPVVALGDFNFDYDYLNGRGNDAFNEFTMGMDWVWARPDPIFDTHWADPDGNDRDNYPHRCRDFTFFGGSARIWPFESRVIVRIRDFPDDDTTSDHRPVELITRPGFAPSNAVTQRIRQGLSRDGLVRVMGCEPDVERQGRTMDNPSELLSWGLIHVQLIGGHVFSVHIGSSPGFRGE